MQSIMDIQTNAIRVVFMGTPDIATYPLKALLEEGYDLVGVITNPDKPRGRKGILAPGPVKKLALEKGIPVFQPAKIRLENDFLPPLQPDLIVTMAYGQIVPREVLAAPRLSCLNLHGSLLPKYRGAAPMQRAIINGEPETGCSLMEMVEKMDEGKVYATERFPITEEDDYGSVSTKMGLAGAKIIREYLPRFIRGELPAEEQEAGEAP